MKSIPGYFEHIKYKTYIDKYPRNIIDLDELKKGKLLEFGPGTGNDLVWLLQHGMLPNRLCSLESDDDAYIIFTDTLYRQLEKMFQDGMPLERLYYMKNEKVASQIRGCTAQQLALFWVFLHTHIDIQDESYPLTESFNYVYANNMLHCLENEADICAAITRAFDCLKIGGVFFGRTLSGSIDSERWAATKKRQEEITRQILAEPIPEVSYFETYERSYQVGSPIGVFRTVIRRLDTVEGQIKLAEYIERKEGEKQERISRTKEAFAIATVNALRDGRLIGVPPEKLEQIARSVGFTGTHVEVREHPWKPTTDFYFRFVK